MSSAERSPSNLLLPAIVAFVGSLLLAMWAYWIDPILNRDGVKYLMAAEAFAVGDFAKGIESYKWPFYSLSIAFFSKLLPFVSLETAAFVLNAVLRGLGGIAFLQISRLMGANRQQIWIATAIYLLFPGLNEVQSLIIRDYGYLCCFLWMVYFFLRQLANPTLGNVFGFLVLGLAATAFRIEGLVYVFGLLVFYLVTGTVKGHIKAIGYGIMMLVIPVLCYVQLMWLYNGDVGNTLNIFLHTIDQAQQDLQIKIDEFESSTVRMLLESASYVILFLSPFVRMLWSTLNVLSLIYVLILIYGWFQRPVLDLQNPRIALIAKGWNWMVGLNVMVLIAFVMITQIVTDRYPLSLALVLMLLIPFILTRLIENSKAVNAGRFKKLIPAITTVLLLLNAAEGLDRFTVNGHIKEAGLFIKDQLKPGDYFLTNNRVIDYYAGNKKIKQDVEYGWPTMQFFVNSKDNRWTHIEWIVFYFNRREPPETFVYLDSVFGDLEKKEMIGPKQNRIIMYNPGVLRPDNDK